VNEEALAHWGGCRANNKQTNKQKPSMKNNP